MLRSFFATLSVALVLGTAGSANAFFGCLGGHGCGDNCCEPSCGCEAELWLRRAELWLRIELL